MLAAAIGGSRGAVPEGKRQPRGRSRRPAGRRAAGLTLALALAGSACAPRDHDEPPLATAAQPAAAPAAPPVREVPPPPTEEARAAAAWAAFLVSADGTDLGAVTVRGRRLAPTTGKGRIYSAASAALYQQLKRKALAQPGFPVQWALLDLDSGAMLSRSAGAGRNVYGASLAKLFVAAALLSQRGGTLPASELQLLAAMIVASDNSAWKRLTLLVGDGQLAAGQRGVQAFMVAHGLGASLGFNGWLGKVHGNELNALDLVRFLRLTYRRAYPGADLLWRLLHSTADVDPKATVFLPTTLQVAGKSGTFGPDHHQVLAFADRGRHYALAILSELGSDEPLAVVAAGLAREFLSPAAVAPPAPGR